MNQIDRLLTIMQRLRDPENGCPWDKEQTFATIAPYTLEETYEVLDAIAREDFDDLRGELGDLLFQVVFYAQMAQEEGRFDFNDICAAISDKLERRHPHVFADSSAENSSEVLARWEQIKTEERAQKAQHSALDDIPRSLPALMRAQKIQKRCANVGFDWTTLGPVVDKVYEEIDEVMYEARQAVVDQAKLEEEMGDEEDVAWDEAEFAAKTEIGEEGRWAQRALVWVQALTAWLDALPADEETAGKVRGMVRVADHVGFGGKR